MRLVFIMNDDDRWLVPMDNLNITPIHSKFLTRPYSKIYLLLQRNSLILLWHECITFLPSTLICQWPRHQYNASVWFRSTRKNWPPFSSQKLVVLFKWYGFVYPPFSWIFFISSCMSLIRIVSFTRLSSQHFLFISWAWSVISLTRDYVGSILMSNVVGLVIF